MTTTEEQIQRLARTIARQEAEVFAMETEIAEIYRDLGPFEERYNLLVKGIAERVKALRDAIIDFERVIRQRRRGDENASVESLWQETAQTFTGKPPSSRPHEPENLIFEPAKKRQVDVSLKQLYRQLARRYHPDLAKDEQDRERRHEVMAIINRAYEEQDKETLRALLQSNGKNQDEKGIENLPLSMLKLRELQQKSADLALRIEELKMERIDLTHSVLMDLKIQNSIARAQGQDLLQEIANDLESEYWELMRQLDVLRSQIS